MPRWFTYIIAFACVLIMASNVLGQDKPRPSTRERMWRVMYCEDAGQGACFRGRKLILKECIAELERIWREERYILACVSESKDGD
jgi:hypothetical protein